MEKQEQKNTAVESVQAPIRFTPGKIKQLMYYANSTKNNVETNRRNVIVQVMIPKDNYRNINFGIDENGVDLNERIGFINLPATRIGLNLQGVAKNGFKYPVKRDVAKNIVLEMPKYPGEKFRLFNTETQRDVTSNYNVKGLYFYMLKERDIKVHFIGKKIKKTDKYEKIEPVVVSGQQMIDMFKEAEIIAEKAHEQKGITKTEQIKKVELVKNANVAEVAAAEPGIKDSKKSLDYKDVKSKAKAMKQKENTKANKEPVKTKAKSKQITIR